MRATLALSALLVACGGAGGTGPTTGPVEDPAALTEQAEAAWAELDPEAAAELAERAIAAGGGTVALEIAGRAHLAMGHDDAALEALGPATSPHLRRLRARAHLGRGDFAAAAAELEGDDDPWAESVRPALAAVGGRPAYQVRGDAAELAMEALPLPVVRVRVDAVETLAVIATSAELTVLDPSVRAAPGVIDELGLGGVRVGVVPHTVRDLGALREGLGVPIGAVLGLDLLTRLHARIDGPGATLGLSSTASAPSAGATVAAYSTPTGSFLAVAGAVAGQPVWLTVDSTGVYPVALVPGADEALGLEDAGWEAADGVDVAVVPVSVGAMRIEGLPVVRGVLDEGHARAVGAPVAGALGWALLAQLVTRFDPERRQLVFE
ncbi:MAG: hypothetical protein H6719_10645 [Sandaracinaceae bacterium]|nr:hypothetical protein [Sandaracinaceae bacterium]